jgi:mono/diheme cytochrome c family protein
MRRHIILLTIFIAVLVGILTESCQSEQELNFARYYTNGRLIYEQHCQNCHGDKGQGLAKLYPPLTDTLYLIENKKQLACIVKHGLQDSITINGIIYKEKMPAESHLPDIDIAAVITYITNSFGNKQGLYDVAQAGTDIKACQEKNDNKQ